MNQREKNVIQAPYYTNQNTHEPRYYQRVAVNRTLDAIARGQNRLLLVMATGTGKTYTAFQIVYRLLKSGLKRKVLYLADRNNLVDQSIQQDFTPLEKTSHKINFAKDDPRAISAYEVYFSLYQQLAGDAGDDNDTEDEDSVEKFQALFRPDFFDLVIVDECHRGSAKKDSNWRRILEYFSSATQLGMTATPRETKYVSNVDYSFLRPHRPDKRNVVLPSGHAGGLQAFLQNKAHETGAFRPGYGVVDKPSGDS